MKLNILVLCKQPEIKDTILRLLSAEADWNAEAAINAEEALQAKGNYDVILLGSGFSLSADKELCNHLQQKHPNARIIEHYGGGSGLLFGEIRAVI
ncbi:MAG: hypothetical protein J0G98_18340 [Terrimonas ferruginea]|uniref:hypothetical protein n=1 Tax=Terrimonas ferruginea TaxID=249 RepID=UPI0009261CE4|nr:hypothetical protein [Terrimonas ferruginea]MBN8785025.1 hypothetical protein [Terrimonas ferruginea]OJW42030.1 MAG: hypothetical protein BGO56_05105 [Sphingobacteriales bacterium 48-107]